MSERGLALFMVLIVTAFLSALTMGIVLTVFMDRLATGNAKAAAGMLYVADAGIELAAKDLEQIADWDTVLAGTRQGLFVDGAAGGVRSFGGRDLDLDALTGALNCGRSSCTSPQMDANSLDRPWGANNPRWRLFAFGAFAGLGPWLRPVPCYLVVWIADDSRELDGNPSADAPGADEPGHGIVRVRAEAFGAGGLRRALEAEISRGCQGDPEVACLPGIRVQSWLDVRQVVP